MDHKKYSALKLLYKTVRIYIICFMLNYRVYRLDNITDNTHSGNVEQHDKPTTQ